METESRGTPRHKTLKSGRLAFNNGHSAIDCTIRNLSETGAKAVVTSTVGIPDLVTLVFDGGEKRECEVSRRTLVELGLHFL
ncbi:MAG: PilZ domain-containing protein [Allorhizobium sp.]